MIFWRNILLLIGIFLIQSQERKYRNVFEMKKKREIVQNQGLLSRLCYWNRHLRHEKTSWKKTKGIRHSQNHTIVQYKTKFESLINFENKLSGLKKSWKKSYTVFPVKWSAGVQLYSFFIHNFFVARNKASNFQKAFLMLLAWFDAYYHLFG